MDDKDYKERGLEEKIERFRLKRREKIEGLGEFSQEYGVDDFLGDLENYFDREVDFNLNKIKKEIEKEGKLEKLICRARQNKTHPVIEYIQEMFKGLKDVY